MKKVLFLMNIKETNGEWSSAINNWYGILEHLGYEVFYEDYREYNAKQFIDLIRTNKPDYIFHPTYDGLHTEFNILREFSKVFLIHSDDDWRFNNYAKFWIPHSDGAIGYQNFSDVYTQSGANKDYYIRARWAFNPNMMKYNFTESKKYTITHVGGLHGGKKQKIDHLIDKGFNISCIDPKFTSYSTYLKTFHESKISLCFTNNSLGTARQSKTRLAELPYYCVLASEPWPNMELWNMEPNKDFILIDENESYIELTNKVLNDTVFANSMYTSAKNILINKNTVFHEWDKIMTQIDEDYVPVDINKILHNFNLV